MKTLKFFAVAMLLALSFVGFSEPVPNAKSTIEAKKQLYASIKNNLFKYNAIHKMESNSSAEFVVYCIVNEQNQVEIVKIAGDMDSVKQNVISIMEKHPIEAPSVLKGKSFAFKLRFESK